MTQFSLSDIKPGSASTENKIDSKTGNGLAIEKMVADEGLTYLEATTIFMEEHGIEYNQYAKYVPKAIIDKLTQECIDNRMLIRVESVSKPSNTLEFLM